jgi:hypothetical protein
MGDMCNTIDEPKARPYVGCTELLGAIADLLECFGTMEGTWYQDNWIQFGISEDMERVMCAAWESKYNAAPNADLERTARSDGTLQDFVGHSESEGT